MSKKTITKELGVMAKEELKKYDKDHVYLKLLAIITAADRPMIEVAEIFKITSRTINNWGRKFRDMGVEGLFEKPNGHYSSKLNDKQKKIIASWLEVGKNADGELIHWTLDKLSLEIKRQFKITITHTPLWKQIKKMGFKQKIPRPVHAKSSKKEQEAFKKNP